MPHGPTTPPSGRSTRRTSTPARHSCIIPIAMATRSCANWCAHRFGEKAADVSARCLGRTKQAVFKMEHVFGYWVDTTNKSGLPTLDEMDHYFIADFFGEALTKWDPDPQLKATWDGINHPTQAFSREGALGKGRSTPAHRKNLSANFALPGISLSRMIPWSRAGFHLSGTLVAPVAIPDAGVLSAVRSAGRVEWSLEIRKNLAATLEEDSRPGGGTGTALRQGCLSRRPGPCSQRSSRAIRKEVPP